MPFGTGFPTARSREGINLCGVVQRALQNAWLPLQGCHRNSHAAGLGSGPRCVVQNKHWHPKQDKTVNRGHHLIGPECLRPLEGQRAACACDNATCKGIGCSRGYMAQFPKAQTDDVIRAIGAKDLAKTKIKIGNRGCRIAPWHFDPQCRCHDESQGTWKLKQHPKKEKFKDSDGEHWNGNPPPNYAPKKFKDEELDGETTLPEERWRQQKSLPPWVAVLSRSERKGSKEAANNNQQVTATSRKNAVALPAPSPLSPNESTMR
jgi:hypothetical protein